jgi:hypothetical protein
MLIPVHMTQEARHTHDKHAIGYTSTFTRRALLLPAIDSAGHNTKRRSR